MIIIPGTLRDVRAHFQGVWGSRRLGITEKTGYTAQATHFIGWLGLVTLLMSPLYFAANPIHLIYIYIGPLIVYWTSSNFYPEYSLIGQRLLVKTLTRRYFSIALLQLRATIDAMLDANASWIVTRRKNLSRVLGAPKLPQTSPEFLLS